MRRPRLAPLLLLSGSTVFCAALLLAAEWAVRAQGLERIRLAPARSAIVHSPLYGWQLRPNWTHHDEGGRQVSTDAQRRRAQARADAPAGAPRVAVLGDSVAFGAGVDDTETFASLLASREGWTVGNFAVPGWGIDQSLLRYEHEARRWRPSTVVLNICLANDLADIMLASYLYDPAWPKPYFTIEDGRLVGHDDHLVRSRPRRAWLWLWENSHLLNLLAARRTQEPGDTGHWMGRRRVAFKDEATAQRLAVLQVRRLAEATRAEATTLLVVLHPDRAAFEERSPLAVRLRDGLSAEGVPALDLAARYREAGWAFADVALDGLGHLSPRGHAVVADAIREELASRATSARLTPDGADQR